MKWDTFLDNYIDELMKKQNDGALYEQQNLFSRKEYYELLKPVIKIINNNKDASIDELRKILYNKSDIENYVKDIVYKKQMIPGIVFTYGTKNFQQTIVAGNQQEVKINDKDIIIEDIEKMDENTIFDLASITKLFTSITILKLVQDGYLSLDDCVTKYAGEFHNLKGVTIYDLMSFKVTLKTEKRIDMATSKDEAKRILMDVKPSYELNLRPYTDLGAMVLKYVIEHITGMGYFEFLRCSILNKIGLTDTHVNIPDNKIIRVASTNLDRTLLNDNTYIINNNSLKGVVYDKKAQILGQAEGDLSGHAGLFSTKTDMTKFARSLINKTIIDSKYLELLAKNKTGRAYIENGQKKYIQYHGFLCYSKNPILSDSELYHALSGKAFASAGWTGTQITIDPINEIFFFMASNRSHNRVTKVSDDKVIINSNGSRVVVDKNNEKVIDSSRFAWDRDPLIVHPALRLTLQYKMLEDVLNYKNDLPKEMVKKI